MPSDDPFRDVRDLAPDRLISRRTRPCHLCGAIIPADGQDHDDWHRRLNATFAQTARYVDQLRQALDRAGVTVNVDSETPVNYHDA